MSKRLHGTIEDVGAEIGFTAAAALVDWFGGTRIWVPVQATIKSPLAPVIGLPALRRLVLMYEGRMGNERLLRVPRGDQQTLVLRDKYVAGMFLRGRNVREVSRATRLSIRHIQRLRRQLEEDGALPEFLRAQRRAKPKQKSKPER